jgi:hypothetical protein
MSAYRQQALIDAPVEVIWTLVGDPARHPEWWPRVVEVKGEHFVEGATYVQTTKGAIGEQTTTLLVESLNEAHEARMRCLDTGTYTSWLLTEARGSTFVDVEFGMEPNGFANRVWDVGFGKRFFRRWLEQSVDALEQAAKAAPTAS